MAARLIAVVNMKGGVGKSSTIVGLAEALGQSGPVLVIDADTQATASYCLAGNSILKKLHDQKPPKTLDQFLRRRFINKDTSARLSEYIEASVSQTTTQGSSEHPTVSLVASSTTLRLSEREVLRSLTLEKNSLVEIEGKITDVLKSELGQLSNDYAYVLIDCAPGISPLTTAAIAIADLVLVPTVPDAPSFLGLAAFLKSVVSEMTFDSARRPPHVLITRLPAKRTTMAWLMQKGRPGRTDHYHEHVEKIRALEKRAEPPFRLLRTMMPESRDMPHAMSLGGDSKQHAPTFNYRYGSLRGSLEKLAVEIEEVLK